MLNDDRVEVVPGCDAAVVEDGERGRETTRSRLSAGAGRSRSDLGPVGNSALADDGTAAEVRRELS